MICLRQASARLPSSPCNCRIACRRCDCGVGIDQVGQALDLRQAELAMLEGAAGELARLRRPQPLHPRQRLEHAGDHRAPAMQLQLGNVLAGLAVRAFEKKHQSLIDDLAGLRIANRGEGRAPRLRHLAGQRLQGARAPADPRRESPRSRRARRRRRGRRWCRSSADLKRVPVLTWVKQIERILHGPPDCLTPT